MVASLARPGGNVTGLSLQSPDSAGKRVQLLREIVPGLHRLAILANPSSPNFMLEVSEAQAAARTFGLDVTTSEMRQTADVNPSTFELLKSRADALFIVADPLVNTNRILIGTLALGARLPTICGFRELVEAGCLMSYGPNLPDLYRRAAEFADKILRGAKPADIPVEQPTKFELVVNLKAPRRSASRFPGGALPRRRGDRIATPFCCRCSRRLFLALKCRRDQRPSRQLSGVKQTPKVEPVAAANDPKRT